MSSGAVLGDAVADDGEDVPMDTGDVVSSPPPPPPAAVKPAFGGAKMFVKENGRNVFGPVPISGKLRKALSALHVTEITPLLKEDIEQEVARSGRDYDTVKKMYGFREK